MYTKEEALFVEVVAFHRIQQLDGEQLKHVAGTLKLKDTGTKLDLFKAILGYLSSTAASTQEKLTFFKQ